MPWIRRPPRVLETWAAPGDLASPHGGVPRLFVKGMIERLAPLRASAVYVSIDADVLDPACAPHVSCPEPFGMALEELFELCAWIGGACNVVGADLCELVPTPESLGVEQALMRCLHALFPKGKA